MHYFSYLFIIYNYKFPSALYRWRDGSLENQTAGRLLETDSVAFSVAITEYSGLGS